MSEERDGWRECADPVELATAVASGVEVQRNWGYDWHPGTNNETAEQFAGCAKASIRYRVPSSWSWSPEPPAPDESTDPPEVKRRTRREVTADFIDGTRTIREWVNGGGVHGPQLCEELDAWLDYWGGWSPAPAPSPVPPWPGAVLSGLTDEDGVPTWLAQAGQVRGEQVRQYRKVEWGGCEDHFDDSDQWVEVDSDQWVEVRAPRHVPVPETERVPWWEALGRLGLAGDPFVEVGSDDEGPWVRVVEGGTKLHSPVAPDGKVEVLKDGDR